MSNNNSGKESHYNITFGILSAFGIIFVVLGHVDCNIFTFNDWIPYYSFHMPLFFFISGYFFRFDNQTSVCKFVVKKTKSLLLPFYIGWLFYLLLQTFLANILAFSIGVKFSLFNWIVSPWINTQPLGFCIAGWFIFTLFLAELFYAVWFKCSGFLSNRTRDYLFLCIVLLLGAVVFKLRPLISCEWIVNIFKAICALTFLHCGYMYREYLEKHDVCPDWLYFLILIFGFGTIKISSGVHTFGLYALTDIEEGFLLWIICGILGIAFWLRIAKLITPIVKPDGIIISIGKNTSAIMMHHLLAIFLIQGAFAIINRWKVIFDSFDMAAYKSHIYYVCSNSTDVKVFLSFGAIFLVILWQNIWNCIKGKYRKMMM